LGDGPDFTSFFADLVLYGGEDVLANQLVVGLLRNLSRDPTLLAEAAILVIKGEPIIAPDGALGDVLYEGFLALLN
jgi:hypothetical protein